ncbi:glycerol kinase GlpK [Elioraea thermophila]|uniref:glycerol kinase GlpK n=1 Tax=Elioraea thermophila TaxID=2185104 RepID=UPI000DF29723|nr:glycerol kinase GlpK [Elioraea thermophila]
MSGFVLAIDQGTTSTRALVFDADRRLIASAQEEFPQHYPAPGWVEHDPEDLWRTTLATARTALARAGLAASAIAAIGLTNQRETTLLWDRASGRPIHRAIVWQDRRTAEACARLRAEGHESFVTARTGLLLDPYFSATKIAWLLDRVEGAREAAEAGRLAFGTVDSWLLWRLTGGRIHATDATNASRTLLLDLTTLRWDEDLCRLFRIPPAILPELRDCADDYGTTEPRLFGAAIPIRGVAGDQQAALIGQACFAPGMVKATYGTGAFALLNTGAAPVSSRNRMLTTLGYRFAGRTAYALEGAVFVAGAAVQWLRDGLGLIATAAETDRLAAEADPDQPVVLVPAFTGLGAPWWDAEARGALFGLTRGTTRRELARAVLDSIAFQTCDLLAAMREDWGGDCPSLLRVDGGLAVSDWTMQRIADLTGTPVDRPAMRETTALGAAWLAGFAAGLYPSPEETARAWAAERRFVPELDERARAAVLERWREAVRRTLSAPPG